MSVDYIKQALQSVKHPLSSSLSLPPACYHDPSWLSHEFDSLFKRGWFCVGRRDQWKRSGDFEALNIAGIPIVITLDSDGDLHGLSNTCLHRSSEIMTGSGNCKAMVCPFHGWSYDHSGQVTSAPRMETACDFAESDLSLKQFHVETCDGFVFLNLEDQPDPLENWLGDFQDMHLPWSLDDLQTGRKRTFDVDCNWKLFIEVFNEYYHLPFVHADSISHYYPEPEPTDAVMGEYTTQFGATSKNPALLEDGQDDAFPTISTLDDKLRNGTRYTWVYPNLTFAASMDCMWVYHVYPLNPTKTRVVQTVCFPSETIARDDFEEKSKTYYHRFDLAIEEDIPALKKQQSGIQSPYAQQGRFSALEPSVGNFACWYSDTTRAD
jgi:phenylpropionate dioxygenase-like ring-hydroxylating dioxygenase large terminal subunit